jgi:carbonic anhydrase
MMTGEIVRSFRTSTSAIVAVLLFTAACGGGDGTASDTDEAAPHWGYEGDVGPANWGQIDDAFAACEAGAEQSPIDLGPTATPANIADPDISWAASDIELVNNGHTIQANVPEGNTTVLAGHEYDLLQFHWHKPSENTVEGDPFAMELHFVHADSAGKLAVLAVLIEPGEASDLYDTIWAAQPDVDATATVEDLDFAELLPTDRKTFVFPGSLTTPPCSEGVAWNVFQAPAQMSPDQIDEFIYDGNARPVQATNDRRIELDSR